MGGIASAGKGAANVIGGLAGKGSGGGGGVSPQEAALAEYTMGQNILKNNSQFATSGTGFSTMKALSNAGAGFGAATQLAGISDTNAAAQNQVNSSLTSLAQQAGGGGGGGSLGTSGGSLDTSGGATS